MTFKEEYKAALTVKAAAFPETIPDAAYFAGTFYEQLDSTAYRLPTVLCGGSIEIGESVSLSFRPLNCRMLLYTQEGSGTFRLSGKDHALAVGSLLYVNCEKLSFSLTARQYPWRVIVFSLGGGFLTSTSLWFPFTLFLFYKQIHIPPYEKTYSSFSPSVRKPL